MQLPIQQEFKLTESFIERYKEEIPPFGFNGLGEFVYMRTYSRTKEDGKNEAWWETVRRVVEGIYNIQKQHIESYRLGWNAKKAQRSAQEMYDRMFNMKFLPGGRGLWAMGTPIIMEKGLAGALFNCSFISTIDIDEAPSRPFTFAMDALMLGIGVGFDTKGAYVVTVKGRPTHEKPFVIPDSREGWVESLGLLIDSYFGKSEYPIFDYSEIREAGQPIKTFGGISSGPAPLKELHESVEIILKNRAGRLLTERDIVDIFNLIGKAVISGNVRRSAELALGSASDTFLDLKNYQVNPDRMNFGWASNNSINAELGMDYTDIANRIMINGEPGLVWTENLRKYGRVRDSEADYKDQRVMGVNPCSEITLENFELCNLVELFPTNHESLNDFLDTIKYAYLYAKTVTLLDTTWPESNRVMLRNRRIGISITGIAQFISTRGLFELKDWLRTSYNKVKYYDKVYSEWFCIPESIKVTTVKPSGTVSLLAGVTPGIHYPESNYYIRRVRLSKNSQFIPILESAGYTIEDDTYDPTSKVVEFPVSVGEVRTLNDVSMWEQLTLASFIQENWADNSVSVTVTFKPEEGKDIASALNYFQFKLKSVSLLPKVEEGAYAQMPYEEITKEKYEEKIRQLIPLNFSGLFSEGVGEKYCNNDTCLV